MIGGTRWGLATLAAGGMLAAVCASACSSGGNGNPQGDPTSTSTGVEATSTPPASTAAATAAATPRAVPAFTASGVRYCGFDPRRSTPAVMPAEVLNRAARTPTPTPTPTQPAAASVPAETTARQIRVLNGLWNAVDRTYVDDGFRGRDWEAIGNRYRAMVQKGLADPAFHAAMNAMLGELGDEHSYFQSPQEVAAEQQTGFTGVGILVVIPPGGRATVITVIPESPAAEAGIRSHDALISIDGVPVTTRADFLRLRGPEGSSISLVVQAPGGQPRTVAMRRRALSTSLPVDWCVVPGTRVGYIMIPTLLDPTMTDKVRAALTGLAQDGPLEGLILDNRNNGGGLGSVAKGILGFFTGGGTGYVVSRESRVEFRVTPEDINGSQDVPLVVLVDNPTVSYGETMSGVLQVAGRAQIVGGPTAGNVEVLSSYTFEDGSRAWIANFTFEPNGLSPGVWEGKGIPIDASVPTRWDLFTEATDPAVAKAIELLSRR
jgi:carboxyl-terminal processing protease